MANSYIGKKHTEDNGSVFIKRVDQGNFSSIVACTLTTELKKEEPVVVKIAHTVSKNPLDLTVAVRSLEKEIDILADFDHQNIIALLGFMKTSRVITIPSLFLPYCPKSLPEYLPTSNQRKQLQLSSDLTLGLSYIHQHHFCHRDIKLENCLISKKGILKISDFGFARRLKVNDVYFSTIKSGTFHYLPPEAQKNDDGYYTYSPGGDCYASALIIGFITGLITSKNDLPAFYRRHPRTNAKIID